MTDLEYILKGIEFCPIFDDFLHEEKLHLAQAAVIRDYKAGDHIFTIRHKDTYFFLVYSGVLSLRLRSRKLKRYEKGELFGEVSIFINEYRSGTITAVEDSKLIAFDITKIFDKIFVPLDIQLKLLKKLTLKIIGYIYEDKTIGAREIIEIGENKSVEFKEAINQKNKKFKEKLVRTMTAFMNLDGGTILIGVKDDGEIVGIEESNQEIDQFVRSVIDIINFRVEEYFSSLVQFDVEEIDGKRLLRIDCDKSMSPVFYIGKDGEEEFIIRTATRNKVLTKTSDIVKYYQENFAR